MFARVYAALFALLIVEKSGVVNLLRGGHRLQLVFQIGRCTRGSADSARPPVPLVLVEKGE